MKGKLLVVLFLGFICNTQQSFGMSIVLVKDINVAQLVA